MTHGPKASVRNLTDPRILNDHLDRRGYPAVTRQVYARGVEHFASWLAGQPKRSRTVDEASVEKFVCGHLPSCRCKRRLCYQPAVRAALHHLLSALRENALLPEAAPPVPRVVQEELDDFCDYLREVGGLAPLTVVSRRQWIDRFLQSGVTVGTGFRPALKADRIRSFLTTECTGMQPGTMQVITSSLRSYLRFRCVRYGDPVERLLAAVPTVANWPMATLPECLSTADIQQWLESFDRRRAHGKRDYAMARCLVDLGLRACEVAPLRFGDLDWSAGTITIAASKSRRADLLPLPTPTERAIADYLRGARPPTSSRFVFVRHRGPRGVPITPSLVRGVMLRAWVRSGLPGTWHGPHVLRHSAATRWLGEGMDLKQIADLLRHRSLDTTMIYTKMDFTRLASLAQPWPGGVE